MAREHAPYAPSSAATELASRASRCWRLCNVARALKPGAALPLATCLVLAACAGARSGTGKPLELGFPSLSGAAIDLPSLRGRVVVVHVFTAGSVAGLADVSELNDAAEHFGERVAVVGLALDVDSRAFMRAWRDESGADYPIGLADAGVASGDSGLGRIAVVPTTVVLDRSGRVAARLEGQLPRGALRAQLYHMLGSG